MQRQIIRIDESRCDGCGQCIVGCPEGALQLIDGKARIVSESTCDGLGACIKECPQDAISVETREAREYDEIETLCRILPQGAATLKAHLKHLYDHAQSSYLEQALSYLRAHDVTIPDFRHAPAPSCPGSTHRKLPTVSSAPVSASRYPGGDSRATQGLVSQLEQWPIQLHLIQPRNPVFLRQSVLLAADCVAFALPDFNQKFLPGKRLLVACPKLDQNQDIYLSKLVTLIDDAEIADMHVLIMEVPCCGGLLRLAQSAAQQAKRSVVIKTTVVGLDGEIRFAS
jgi:NAD-dependent dihydropyrimidine dehydrogenase PreA subunit